MDRPRVWQFFLLLSMASAETTEVREAMVQFMQKLAPQNIQREPNFGWNLSSDPCGDKWKGVTCYVDSPRIKKIVLNEENLTGLFDAASLCVSRALLVLSLNSNNIVGMLPEEISACSLLTHVYLSGNNFSGDLPGSLSSLSDLKRFDVSRNGFYGVIPDMSRISGLLTFRAENNRLTGGIPQFDFSKIQDFNVSYNNLSGEIPDVKERFHETSFLGNPGLCGKPTSNTCTQKKNKGKTLQDYLMYSGYAVIGLLIFCLIGFKLIMKCKSKQKDDVSTKDSQTGMVISPSSESKSIGGGNRSEFSITSVESGKDSSLTVLHSPVSEGLKFEDLLRAPAILIGRGKNGSLYKVTLSEGVILAVKRIKGWDVSKDEFTKRMEAIDQVKHPNVLPVIAFYCSRQEKLLVYDFQEIGNLFKLLHGPEKGEQFHWESRLDVAAKIADALAFMHERLQTVGIPHGNLKSSNILLNKEMEPLVSEYGLAVINNQADSHLAQMERSQDNDFPIVNERNNIFKADVYNFGVILLELLTGELVPDNGYDLAAWVDSAIREEWTKEVFEKSLVSEGANAERMVNLLQVASECISSSAEMRPSMREVAHLVNSIKEYEEKSKSSDR
ncbi:probable inactive receptor kinase At2g26730 [Primulina eburnea]|uniref:probable inactive receptor kinase At2g26730 n=1 Tax=Primulina eburnea TaxID=1245227 RepID=UPI003C6C73EB